MTALDLSRRCVLGITAINHALGKVLAVFNVLCTQHWLCWLDISMLSPFGILSQVIADSYICYCLWSWQKVVGKIQSLGYGSCSNTRLILDPLLDLLLGLWSHLARSPTPWLVTNSSVGCLCPLFNRIPGNIQLLCDLPLRSAYLVQGLDLATHVFPFLQHDIL